MYHEALTNKAMLNDWGTSPKNVHKKMVTDFLDGGWTTQETKDATNKVSHAQMETQAKFIGIKKLVILKRKGPQAPNGNTQSHRKLVTQEPNDVEKIHTVTVSDTSMTTQKPVNVNVEVVNDDQMASDWSKNNYNAASDGKSITIESIDSNDSTGSNGKLIIKQNRIRHSNRIKLATRYGNFWVQAEKSFRRPFDSLASGIIG